MKCQDIQEVIMCLIILNIFIIKVVDGHSVCEVTRSHYEAEGGGSGQLSSD